VIVYQKTKRGFLDDIDNRDIEDVVAAAYLQRTGRYAAQGEFNAWRDSLRHMAKVLRDDGIPADAGVGIEFGIPQSQKRIDFILSGFAEGGEARLVIVELKQWSSSRLCDLDGIIVARRGGKAEVEGPHPCYQAWSYAAFLHGFNEAVYDGQFELSPCAYLHNYVDDGIISDKRYGSYIEQAPLFLKGEAELVRLREFVKRHVRRGDEGQLLYRVENGRIRPSKMLADSLVGMLRGNQEFVLLDEQKLAYETALAAARRADARRKHVVLIKGGPGTGKSVIAINLLASLTKLGLLTKYVSKNAAPRTVYQTKLAGSLRRREIDGLFGGSGNFYDEVPGRFDALIVDEAHRLNRLSGLYANLGENQVMEIIRSAKCSIFFVDDNQVVTLTDIGNAAEIRHWAKVMGAEVSEVELESQFRCNGSEGYLPWLDDVLGIERVERDSFDRRSFEFQVVDSPDELHALVESRNDRNRARMVAGYCWDWKSKKDPRAHDIVIDNYRRQWNLGKDGSLWIVAPESVSEVGCIHTCQGLEVDHVGVIIGPDLVFRNGRLVTSVERRSKMDRTVRGYKTLLKEGPPDTAARIDRLIRNTYRTLMTRGLRSCSIYCTDPETQEYFKHRINGSR
jgi:DUF2075 family protein